jgi:hypothetical protein
MNKPQVAAKFRLKRGLRERMPLDRAKRALVWAALLTSALAGGGCAMSIADLPFVGTPANAPGASKEAGSYLPVEDLPPGRNEAVIAPDQQAKIRAELLAARDRQASTAGTKDPATKDSATK